MTIPEHGELLPKVTRREFLRDSAAIAAALSAISSVKSATVPAAESQPAPLLFLPPLLSCPTETSIRITALNDKVPTEAVIELRKEGIGNWERKSGLKVSAYEILNWNLKDLTPATRYEYRVLTKQGSEELRPAANGSFRTQRKSPATYTAVLLTDSHTGYFPAGSGPVLTLDQVVQNAARAKAEFVLDLGDNVAWRGSREFAQTSSNGALSAYAQYRRQIGPLSMHCPHFSVIGNWVGENGKFPERNIEFAAAARRTLLPGPNHLTYPQGGSEREDYYAFSWGDALYVILNVQTYSKPSDPAGLPNLMSDVNRITEWTLGEKQMAWFEATLKNASERYRFVCIHHPAAGNAGDALNTMYGRGGARAWNIGEQARIHALMKKHKVQIFFYGHDHVFVDDIVEGIHYTLPGSAGAPWKFTKEETGYERSWPDSGHAQLDITPEKATVTFINIDGRILHNFTVLPA